MRSGPAAAGALGALLAMACLICLALLPRPFPGMDHFAVLGGFAPLPGAELDSYARYLRWNLSLDSVYLLGHAIMWVGLACTTAHGSRLPAVAALSLGLGGVLLDFAENEMRRSSLTCLTLNQPLPAAWIASWQVVFGMSFWALFLAALAAGIALVDLKGAARPLRILAWLAIPAAAAVPALGHFPAFLWLIAWHAAAAVFLWTKRGASPKNLPPHEA